MNIQDYVKVNDAGEMEFDEKAFQSWFDNEKRNAVETYKSGKGKEEMRRIVEEEAKLTAEEKLKSEKEEFEKYKLETKIGINKDKARARLENKGFTEKEVNYLLKNVTDNEEESLKEIDELIAERAILIDSTKKSAIENLQSGQQMSNNPTTYKPTEEQPKPVEKRTQQDTLDYYRKRK